MDRQSMCAVLVACVIGPLEASAAPSDPGPAYQVAAGCPNRAQWEAALRARLPERLWSTAERRSFRVEIESEPGSARYAGKIDSESVPSGEARSVTGASCSEVADALTLIAALELQQDEPAAPAPALEDPWSEFDDVDEGSAAAGAGQELGALRVRAIGFALVQSVTAPRLSTDFGIGVSLSWQTNTFQPWLMLGFHVGADEVGLPASNASARFERWATHVVGCPLRFPRESRAAVRPCVDFDLGRLTGEGRGVSLARDSSAWLASAGAGLRFEWAVWDRLELGAQAGGVLALSRPRFFFAPDFTALEVPVGGLRAGASASMVF